MYANLFWIWGHPGLYCRSPGPSYSQKSLPPSPENGCLDLLFECRCTISSPVGAGPDVNVFFGITTMISSTGVKIFNWLLTMYRTA